MAQPSIKIYAVPASPNEPNGPSHLILVETLSDGTQYAIRGGSDVDGNLWDLIPATFLSSDHAFGLDRTYPVGKLVKDPFQGNNLFTWNGPLDQTFIDYNNWSTHAKLSMTLFQPTGPDAEAQVIAKWNLI
jgi:hypothetical protein